MIEWLSNFMVSNQKSGHFKATLRDLIFRKPFFNNLKTAQKQRKNKMARE